MSSIRRFLKALLPLQAVFSVIAVLALVTVLYTLIVGNSDLEAWLLPLVMLFAWCASLSFTLSGHRFLQGASKPETFWLKIKLKLVTGTVWLLELLFMLTCAVLLWLSVRAIGMLF